MKYFSLSIVMLLALAGPLFSQSRPYKAVFDITTEDPAVHQRVIRWINYILETSPEAKLEVVLYGKSLTMVENETSSVANDIKRLVASKNVKFEVCEHSMKVHNVTKNMLLPGVGTVPDAIYELVTKQADGFGYIKVTN